MSVAFRIVGVNKQNFLNPKAAENVVYFAEQLQKEIEIEGIRLYSRLFNQNLDDIVHAIKLKYQKDVNGRPIDRHTWEVEKRAFIDITKKVSAYLKSFRY